MKEILMYILLMSNLTSLNTNANVTSTFTPVVEVIEKVEKTYPKYTRRKHRYLLKLILNDTFDINNTFQRDLIADSIIYRESRGQQDAINEVSKDYGLYQHNKLYFKTIINVTPDVFLDSVQLQHKAYNNLLNQHYYIYLHNNIQPTVRDMINSWAGIGHGIEQHEI